MKPVFTYDMTYLENLITVERFRTEVELWRTDGTVNSVEVCFTPDNKIILVVPSFENPNERLHFMASELTD